MAAGESASVRLARVEERGARIEDKVDRALQVANITLARIDELDDKFMPRREVDSKLEAVKGQVTEMRTSRRWALATFLPIGVSLVALAVTIGRGVA